MTRFENANAIYTGGNIWLFHGKLKDGNYFLTDDEGWTMILDSDPSADWDESLMADWQAVHLNYAIPDYKQADFCDALADRLLSHNPADDLGGITDREIEAYRKYWKEPF